MKNGLSEARLVQSKVVFSVNSARVLAECGSRIRGDDSHILCDFRQGSPRAIEVILVTLVLILPKMTCEPK